MVVTNFEPQYGELDPVSLTFRILGTVAELETDQEHYDTCYPVDGDMINRARARGQHQRAAALSMTTMEPTRWAQESLHVDRMGITGHWVHGHENSNAAVMGFNTYWLICRPAHSYRRWADQ